MYHLTQEEWEKISLMGHPNISLIDDAYYMGGEYKLEQAVGSSQLLPYGKEEVIYSGRDFGTIKRIDSDHYGRGSRKGNKRKTSSP